MKKLAHKFVELIPENIEAGVLYVSLAYGTAIHRCCCGCGREVVTPLTPTDWKLIFDGEAVSLYPSIGSWRFRCRSHYWIWQGQIEWGEDGASKAVRQARVADQLHRGLSGAKFFHTS